MTSTSLPRTVPAPMQAPTRSPHPFRPTLVRSAALVAVEALLGTGLARHPVDLALPRQLDADGLRAWVDRSTPDQALLAMLRGAALVLLGYLIVVTVLATAAEWSGRRGHRGFAVILRLATSAGTRRVLQRALGSSLVLGAVAGGPAIPVWAEEPGGPASAPITMTVDEPAESAPPTEPDPTLVLEVAPPDAVGAPAPGVDAIPPPRSDPPTDPPIDPPPDLPTDLPSDPPMEAPSATPSEGPTDPATVPVVPAQASGPIRAAATWTIAPGEHLWYVAERTVADHVARPPTVAEVAGYHQRLIAANRDRLVVPDDPDLVFAGQEMVVPDLSPAAPAPAT